MGADPDQDAGRTDGRRGAFGLCLPGLADAAELLVAASPGWPAWRIEHASGGRAAPSFVDDSRAVLACEPSGWMEIDRAASLTRLRLPRVPSHQEIVQPRLAATAIVAAHWRGAHSFHAGAFMAGGLAWGVLGSRQAGKSSLLAALALMDVPVFADDLLVLDRRLRALAGPRCIDLREPAARALGVGESIGVVGTRERWRMALGPVAREVPLGGFVLLEWGAGGVSAVRPAERLRMLTAAFALRLAQRDDGQDLLRALIEIAALPMLRLRRPRRISALGKAAQQLLGAIGERSGAA